MKKEQKFSKFGFIISAIGSAIGLGSIWRFPTVMAQSGGGAFLIPFFLSMLICGIPLLMFEMNVGNKYRKSQVSFFESTYGIKGKYYGLFYPTVALLIVSFYGIIIAWVVIQFFLSFTNKIFVEGYLFDSVIQITDNPNNMGSPSGWLIIAFLFVLIFGAIISLLGIKSGIQQLNKILVPLLFILVFALTIYSATLPGAGAGLNKMWKPVWKELGDSEVWTNAFSQTFFSLSLAMGPIFYYSSQTEQDQDNNNAAFVVALPLILISLLPGIATFAFIGFLSNATGHEVSDLMNAGTKLVFNVWPQIFDQIRLATNAFLAHIIAITFYISLFSAAITSYVSLVEVGVGNLDSANKKGRTYNTALFLALTLMLSLPMTFQGGIYLIDAIDIWADNIWLFVIGIVQICLVTFVIKNKQLKTRKEINEVIEFGNQQSWIKLRRWYIYLLMFIILILATMLGLKIYDLIHALIHDNTMFMVNITYGLIVGLGFQLLFPLIIIGWNKLSNRKKAISE